MIRDTDCDSRSRKSWWWAHAGPAVVACPPPAAWGCPPDLAGQSADAGSECPGTLRRPRAPLLQQAPPAPSPSRPAPSALRAPRPRAWPLLTQSVLITTMRHFATDLDDDPRGVGRGRGRLSVIVKRLLAAHTWPPPDLCVFAILLWTLLVPINKIRPTVISKLVSFIKFTSADALTSVSKL